MFQDPLELISPKPLTGELPNGSSADSVIDCATGAIAYMWFFGVEVPYIDCNNGSSYG